MKVLYDPISRMFTLEVDEDNSVFEGTLTHIMSVLRTKYKLNPALAREVCTKAIADIGAPVDVDVIRRYIP